MLAPKTSPASYTIPAAVARYGSIIFQDRPVHDGDVFSRKHPKMSQLNRAKIFAPFAALVGFDERVRKKEINYISNSINASIEDIHNEMQLIYFFINEPRAELQERSAIHYGTATLRVNNPDTITGNYYTGRLTRGSMDFNAERE